MHWSPLAWGTANSHGDVSWEYHLTVVLPCVGLCVLSVQKCWSWLCVPLNVLKPSPACVKPPNRHSPLCWFFKKLVWFLEQRFGSHSKWWQRQWWDRTQNPKGGSHYRRVRGLFNTHNAEVLIIGVGMMPSRRPATTDDFYMFTQGELEWRAFVLLNFSADIWQRIWNNCKNQKVWLLKMSPFCLIVQSVGLFFDTWGRDGAWGCLARW